MNFLLLRPLIRARSFCLGESPPEYAATNVDPSSIRPPEAIGNRGTTANYMFNDAAVHPFELGDRKVNDRDQAPINNEEPRRDVSNLSSYRDYSKPAFGVLEM